MPSIRYERLFIQKPNQKTTECELLGIKLSKYKSNHNSLLSIKLGSNFSPQIFHSFDSTLNDSNEYLIYKYKSIHRINSYIKKFM